MKLINLLLPSVCVGCENLGEPLCEDCFKSIQALPRRIHRGLSGWAFVDYSATAVRLINCFKERGRTALLSRLCALTDGIELPSDLVLVGLPSSLRNTRKRGFVPGVELARGLALRHGVQHADALRFERVLIDQAGLAKSEREKNLSCSMTARPVAGRVWLVDDVVTTGASIREAARAFEDVGVKVDGFLAIAETLAKNDV